MHVRIPPELAPAFEREIRRRRLYSSLKIYPLALLVFSGGAILAVFVKEPFLVEFVMRHLNSPLTETQIVIRTAAGITLFVAVLLAGFFWFHTRAKLFEEYSFCPRCNALDFLGAGTCPCCVQPLSQRAAFFFTIHDDDKKVVEEFGLKESRK